MRSVYLIRHGRPDFPAGETMCLGRTDVPLGPLGRLQAALLGGWLQDRGVTDAFCSRLSRSRETAALLSSRVTELDGLEELSSGEWDGLCFSEIKRRWPEIYAARGTDPSIQPPGAESRALGLSRFGAAVGLAVDNSCGSIAIVAHATVMQIFLCRLLGMEIDRGRELKLPYGSCTKLDFRGGNWSVGSIGLVPNPPLTRELCDSLLAAFGTPANVVEHSRAVAREAMRIVRALNEAGAALDEGLVLSSALLHDIARAEDSHAARGAGLLNELGYPAQAEIIRQHHDLDDCGRLDEAAVVYIADKLVSGAETVGLARRFSASEAKCKTPAARAVHKRRFTEAASVAGMINKICGKEVII